MNCNKMNSSVSQMPNIVVAYENDSDSDSDGMINWKDYYGDDEEGVCFRVENDGHFQDSND